MFSIMSDIETSLKTLTMELILLGIMYKPQLRAFDLQTFQTHLSDYS